ncbi:MAG TPA: translation elongation factor Ts [Flavobacteriaceae bacterium]|nr:elongation factor Ts [Flavobacteriaceae bacterium]MCB9212228.1 elongation factor Ts [Alteromonas sp.]HPF10393.1 translation elongation factor Ts [Flavobacteriaceae bacterium]HQU20457.1 translation elongation factor Ts [Flavobacteriaceae bacterium]HQU64604.1 translation elongation factor Ts [Flavobacteriaceae bacterium]
MVQITAAQVNELRQKTGAGMMDCKKALVEAEGDFDQAIAILRKKGQKIAEKRADRDSSEGVVIAKVNDAANKGVIVSLNCETDFVAKNDDFVALAHQIADAALNVNTMDELLVSKLEGMTVQEKLTEQTGVIGEKIELGGFKTLEAPFVGSYTHGNKIGALVGLSKGFDGAAEVAKNISMQVASMGATTLSYKDFDAAFIASETEARIAAIEKDNEELKRLGKTLKNVPTYISRAQLTDAVIADAEAAIKAELKAEGKPEQIWDKIVPGKLERFIADNTTLDQEKCLLDQTFIMDEKQSVAQYIASKGAVTVVSFERISLA